MVPWTCRILVWLAALMVPRTKRKEWTREWFSELWHCAAAGAAPDKLRARAAGAFRDAAFFLESERKRYGYDLFRRPLRVEAAFACAAILIGLSLGTFRTPQLPYADAGRLVTFEHKIPFMGGLDSITNAKEAKLLREQPAVFADLANYTVVRDPVLYMRVSKNFFDLLGVKPILGRTFRADDYQTIVVLPYETWRNELRGDRNVIGKHAIIDRRPYTIIGVLPPDFWFRSPRFRFFTTFSARTTAAGTIARLQPGVTVAAAQAAAQKIESKLEPGWVTKTLELRPLLRDPRQGDLGFAVGIALIGALLAVLYAAFRSLGGWRFRWMLGARVWLTLFGLGLIRWSLLRPRLAAPFYSSFFVLWMFLLLCSAAACMLAIDHRGRCPVCLSKLRKPVAIGSFGSLLLDQPATEYLCPAGHGTLYVSETSNAEDHWTVFDESWKDLFTPVETSPGTGGAGIR